MLRKILILIDDIIIVQSVVSPKLISGMWNAHYSVKILHSYIQRTG
jgi:hypothetical protein